jgi:hypothetical protein
MTLNINNQLKDFQEATVEYVFKRFMDSENHCNRFLVADEVGLGKTLVARGIIKKIYDHFKSIGKSQLNVVYICSNQSIASQNMDRLNIEQHYGVVTPPIRRINDLAVSTDATDERSFLQIIALSPNTSFNVSKGGGVVHERAVLFHILCKHPEFSGCREKLNKIFRLDVSEENWEGWTGKNNWIKTALRTDVVTTFNTSLQSGNEYYKQLISACENRYNSNEQYAYRRMIGGLRRLLASICVKYLKPDLIIMDEFQRFKYLIDTDEDGDVKLITESLFTNKTIKILLLSATPYKMYSLQSEEEEAESHFKEFNFVVDFLLNDEARKKTFSEAWNKYSKSLLHLEARNWPVIKEEKNKVESILRSVIARTERITVSDDKNTLLRPSQLQSLFIKPGDIRSFISADSVASKLKDVNSPVEYCKSSPYPFSFMEGYQLQKMTQREIANGNAEIKSALRKSRDSFLPIDKMGNYTPIQNPNAKLTYLLNDILYNGGSDLLWIPPSHPYYAFDGSFKGKEGFSKVLVFSSWIMVPKMIAALSSYECERLTIANPKAISNAEDRSERKYFHTGSERHPKARLRFRIEKNNYSTLSSYALLYPCITLSELWKPLNKPQSLHELIDETSTQIQLLISRINVQPYITDPNKKDDDRWALLYMLLLDRNNKSKDIYQFKEKEDKVEWNWVNRDEENSNAYQYYKKIFGEILFADPSDETIPAWRLARGEKPDNAVRKAIQELNLGNPPADIAKKLAYLTIASPAICAYRLLRAFATRQKQFDFIAFFGAFRIADSFRKFFNWSENIAVIDKLLENNHSYWQNLLVYAANGNFQAMLDEFATAMIDHNGLWDYSLDKKLNKLIELVAENIGLRTVSVIGHTYESFIKESKPSHFRCHFGVALNQSMDNEKDVLRSDSVRDSFNSPFRPFILATTSIGQEGLDFHLYCRKILHWNLPANPVDFEQREGRINRFKNLAIRQNIAIKYGGKLAGADSSTLWDQLYQIAIENEKGNKSDLVPFWHVEPQNIFIERQVPTIPYSKEVRKLKDLLKTISVYRIALGQPRQEDLVNHLINNFNENEIEKVQEELLINLSPYRR